MRRKCLIITHLWTKWLFVRRLFKKLVREPKSEHWEKRLKHKLVVYKFDITVWSKWNILGHVRQNVLCWQLVSVGVYNYLITFVLSVKLFSSYVWVVIQMYCFYSVQFGMCYSLDFETLLLKRISNSHVFDDLTVNERCVYLPRDSPVVIIFV